MMNQQALKTSRRKIVFLGDQQAELTILKANFPENTLVYVNQGTVSLVIGGDKAIYLDFVLVGRLCLLQMLI